MFVNANLDSDPCEAVPKNIISAPALQKRQLAPKQANSHATITWLILKDTMLKLQVTKIMPSFKH